MSTNPAFDPVVIVSVARTPMGGLLGVLSPLSGVQLGSAALKAAVERAGIAPADVEEVILGNCLIAGQGQAPARQAALAAGNVHAALDQIVPAELFAVANASAASADQEMAP